MLIRDGRSGEQRRGSAAASRQRHTTTTPTEEKWNDETQQGDYGSASGCSDERWSGWVRQHQHHDRGTHCESVGLQNGSRLPAVSSSAVAQNSAVIAQAAQGADNQAQLGAAAIQEILTKKLGLNPTLDFNLNHQTPPAEGGDCYVALGANAVNFENMPGNILRSPNGKDVVFVQSDTTTPLAKCLVAGNTALGW